MINKTATKTDKVLVWGGNGFLGRAVCEELKNQGYIDVVAPPSYKYDLTYHACANWAMDDLGPFDFVVNLAAFVGGIGLNRKQPWDLFHDNLTMGLNVIRSCVKYIEYKPLKNVVFVSTVCGYPSECPTPFKEEDMYSGLEEETNRGYGQAKKVLIAGLKAAKDQHGLNSAVVVPTNLIGWADDFSDNSSHFVPAIIKKIDLAKTFDARFVKLWGTGRASRDVANVKDVARGVVSAMEKITDPMDYVNLGSGKDYTIKEIAEMVSDRLGYEGKIVWDEGMPDGQKKRQLCIDKAKKLLNWSPEISLEQSLTEEIKYYYENIKNKQT